MKTNNILLLGISYLLLRNVLRTTYVRTGLVEAYQSKAYNYPLYYDTSIAVTSERQGLIDLGTYSLSHPELTASEILARFR